MADNEHGYFWNSNEGDRIYDADSFSNWLKKFFTTGVFQNDLQVTADGGMVVRVGTGYANIEGKVRMFDAETTFTIAASNSRYPRIDTIVVQKSENARSITLEYVQGGASANPSAVPPTRSGGIYQLVLAQVYVAAGATSITQANITDKRPDSSVCGWVTGTVEEVDISQIMSQSQTQFNEWFANIQEVLDEDTAGHLQNEIEAVEGKAVVQNAVSADLDTYVTQGIYSFEDVTPTNAPLGIRGFLIVIQNEKYVKQIWTRTVSSGNNDADTLTRQYDITNQTWNEWRRLAVFNTAGAIQNPSGGYIGWSGQTAVSNANSVTTQGQYHTSNNTSNLPTYAPSKAGILIVTVGNGATEANSTTVTGWITQEFTDVNGRRYVRGRQTTANSWSAWRCVTPITETITVNLNTLTWTPAGGVWYSSDVVPVNSFFRIDSVVMTNWGALNGVIVPYVHNTRIAFMSASGTFNASSNCTIRIEGIEQ